MKASSNSAGNDLIEAIAEAVVDLMKDVEGTKQRVYDIEPAALYLGLTVEALRKLAGTKIPVLTYDRRLRFDKRDLDRFIDQAPRRGGSEQS